MRIDRCDTLCRICFGKTIPQAENNVAIPSSGVEALFASPRDMRLPLIVNQLRPDRLILEGQTVTPPLGISIRSETLSSSLWQGEWLHSHIRENFLATVSAVLHLCQIFMIFKDVYYLFRNQDFCIGLGCQRSQGLALCKRRFRNSDRLPPWLPSRPCVADADGSNQSDQGPGNAATRTTR